MLLGVLAGWRGTGARREWWQTWPGRPVDRTNLHRLLVAESQREWS